MASAKGYGIWMTHDIDHIRVGEHYTRDLFLFRLLAVSGLEMIKGKRSLKSMAQLKLGLLKKDNWDHFKEWIMLEKKYRMNSTWFFAVTRGKSLSYNHNEIEPIVHLLKKKGFDLGLHGQAADDEVSIRREFELFKKIVGEYPKGIRMHYLNLNKESLGFLSDIYCYDSSLMVDKLEPPKKTLRMLEIPIHIMDTYLFSPLKMNLSLEDAKKYTRQMLNKAKRQKRIVVFDIHPHHISPLFPRHKAYIYWLYEHIMKDKACKRFKVMEILRKYDI